MASLKPCPVVGQQARAARRPAVRVTAFVQQTPTAAPLQTPPAVVVDPFETKLVYKDNWLERWFIKVYTVKLADQLVGVPVPEDTTYDDFVSVSKQIMKGRTPEQQHKLVLSMLNTLLPKQASMVFRKLFPPTKTSAELNAFFAYLGFAWLVGEMELQTGDVQISPTEVRQQKSIVKIKKCRYLEASGCVGLCVNMCKVPTQTFFTEGFGLPLTMKPKFEDLSCEMIFGQAPQPEDVDEAFKQPCFKIHCNTAVAEPKACIKLQGPPVKALADPALAPAPHTSA
mmetsp:Transcript_2068/g.3279  ORF Transcript_2068/g.3279 Transcript_2068/m.3279 type:complete len:284 (+) Transcript_2068:2-853(+)